ncbi:hypothetical protein MNBD_GAMMA05-1659 [hydrothermal vent metagenome]|uniref:Uncharacterized protein n=1 Tax=hydrothermal vent metagenome TaxID=652676 RepID=A0A3B0WTS5_9ZZZZ
MVGLQIFNLEIIMNKYTLLLLSFFLLTACNFKEGLKETGDAVQDGTQNAIEGLKEVPGAVSEASNKVEKEIRD